MLLVVAAEASDDPLYNVASAIRETAVDVCKSAFLAVWSPVHFLTSGVVCNVTSPTDLALPTVSTKENVVSRPAFVPVSIVRLSIYHALHIEL